MSLFFVLVPHERIVSSRWREPFFFLWSLMNIALAVAVASADGGSTSPLALLFFIPLIFAALSYPMVLVVAIGAIDYVAYVAVGVGGRTTRQRLRRLLRASASPVSRCSAPGTPATRIAAAASCTRVSRADPLTGCLNRRGFEERFDAELSRAPRTGRPLGLIMLDLDTSRRSTTPRVTPPATSCCAGRSTSMQRSMRPMDTIGRFGGDEFAIILPGAAPSDTARVADRLAERHGRARAGLGRHRVLPHRRCRPERAVLRRADNELYARKHGRSAQQRGVPTQETMSLSWATALAHAVDERITVKQAHSRKVAKYCSAMAKRTRLRDDEIEALEIAARPARRRQGRGPGPHPAQGGTADGGRVGWRSSATRSAGAEIVARIKGLEQVVPWIRHARENFDGSGYPDGLKGDEIPLQARILHVASAFDAMVTGRPYRSAFSVDEAVEELKQGAGTQFDPQCVELFERLVVPTLESPGLSRA